MFYEATVVITRGFNGRDPAGVTQVTIVSQVQAGSWGEAANQVTERVLDEHIHGGLAGSEIVSVELRALRG